MAVNYEKAAERIIHELGGKKNIATVTHCVTRLRFVLKDESVVDDEKVKKIKGVLGVMKKGGQYQVIIGSEVANCYKEVVKIGGFSSDAKEEENKPKQKLTPKTVVSAILDAISGSISPILPAIIGGGMIKLVCSILGLIGVPADNMTYQLLAILGAAPFYFLPLLLAYSASKKFGCNTALAMGIVGVLEHPDLINLLAGEAAVTFLKIPVYSEKYASSVIPAILICWVLSYVEKLVDKITPGWTKTVFKPTLIMLIMLPLSIIVLAPAGAFCGNGLQFVLNWLNGRAGWLTMMIFSAAMPFIVMTGMHHAFVPGCLSDLATNGFDTLLIPAMLASNLAEGAATLAVALRSKNSDLKAVSGSASASALIAGITEPALYGVTLKYKRPVIAACIGAGCSGLFIGIVNLKAYVYATPAFISIVQFISPKGGMNFIYALIAAAISIVVTFVMTLVLGWEDPVEEEEENEESKVNEADEEQVVDVKAVEEKTSEKKEGKVVIEAPVPGKVIPLDQVNDETFATGILGKGIAVEPSEGKVYAPFDGVCENLFDTLHALALVSDTGIVMLIHVGLETVALEGKPFTAHVKTGDRIKKGQLLLEFDMEEIKNSGCETVTPVLITNEDEIGKVSVENGNIVIGG